MSKNVVVVEDDPAIQESLRMAIELEGYNVYLANNGREGLKVLSTLVDPCIILLDLMMPVMDGFEFLAARKQDSVLSKVPVAVVTAFLDKAKGLDAQGFVKKPVNLDDLFDFIKKYCH
jgi:CheY-like chemotaxis protein